MRPMHNRFKDRTVIGAGVVVTMALLFLTIASALWALNTSRVDARHQAEAAARQAELVAKQNASLQATLSCWANDARNVDVAQLDGQMANMRYILSLQLAGDNSETKAAVQVALDGMEQAKAARSTTEVRCPVIGD